MLFSVVSTPGHDIPTGPEPPCRVTCVIEIPTNERNKYELDKTLGVFRLDRVLHSAVHYPGDYGFLPRTLAEDGDPLDVLVRGDRYGNSRVRGCCGGPRRDHESLRGLRRTVWIALDAGLTGDGTLKARVESRATNLELPMTHRSRSIHIHRFVPLIASVLLLAVLGCGEQATAPSLGEAGPALAATAAGPLAFRQVSVGGGNHACGVTTDDRAYCWGYNGNGELGDGTTTNSRVPSAVLGGLSFRHVNVGQNHSCGVTTGDRAYCWGFNGSGQLGDGTHLNRSTPVAVAGGHLFRQIRAGIGHTCAITPERVAYCWGAGGRLGDGTNTERLVPVLVLGGLHWRQLGGGNLHTCGVTTGDKAYCWGNNGNGELGDGTRIRRLRPTPVTGGLSFRQIDAGNAYSCGVTTADRAYCWGSGGFGQRGDGTTTSARLQPRAVLGNRRFENVSAGWNHTCGVMLAGRGFCWGMNNTGQLGDGSTVNRSAPTALGIDLVLVQVTGGVEHTCGVTRDDRAYCWGHNNVGQLGDGTTVDRRRPVPVAGQ